MDELELCKECGGKATLKEELTISDASVKINKPEPNKYVYKVKCNDCGVETSYHQTVEKARKAWEAAYAIHVD